MNKNLINQEKDIIEFLYVFNEGRQKRLNYSQAPQDFFYFYQRLKQKVPSTTFIELEELNSKKIFLKILKIIEKIIIKFFKLPFYGHKLLSQQNLQCMKRSKHLVLTNETIGYSMLLIVKYLRRSNPDLKVTMFIMGLFQESNLKSGVKRLLLNSLLQEYDKFIFLGESEYEYACIKKNLYSAKYHYLTFAIDNDYWVSKSTSNVKDTILFVGNDVNRDYQLLKKITNELGNYKFTIVSNRVLSNELNSNVELINSDWRSATLTDGQLKNIYQKAKISLIPTKNTIQPSGQSVGLQCISMKIPLIVSESKGFWGRGILENSKDIFILQNDASIWKKAISNLMEDDNLHKDIIQNAYLKFQKNYDYQFTFKQFMKIIE